MKVAGKELIFRAPLMQFTKRRLGFLRKGNSIQLLETAVVVEGYQQRLSMPIVDRFFLRALSEWTTVTIPYSRIRTYRYRSRRWLRWAMTLLAWAPVVFLVAAWLDNFANGRVADAFGFLTGIAVAAVLAGVFTLYFFLEGCTPRNTLTFQKADGKRATIVFSIRDRARQDAFREQIELNLSLVRRGGEKP